MFKDILIPINTSDKATWENPVKTGIELAQATGSTLHVMTVFPRFDYPVVESFFPVDFEEKAHAKANEELHKFVAENFPKGLKIQTIMAVGSVYEEILATAEKIKCDLIIMSRKGRLRRHFNLGSNVNRVIHHATTSVLVLE